MTKVRTSLVVLVLSIVTLILAACSKTTYEIVMTDDFNNQIVYNSEIDLTGLEIKATKGNDVETIPVTEEMVTSEGTAEVGLDKKLTITYEDLTKTVSYDVKYLVEFKALGEVVSSQMVVTAAEIKYPEDPIKEGYEFIGWTIESIEDITNNMVVEAKYKSNLNPEDLPKLENLTATYGDTLEDITLPGNELGQYAFTDSLETSVGNAGNQEFNVVFNPFDTENYVPYHTKATINVKKLDVNVTTKNVEKNYKEEVKAEEFYTLSDNYLPNDLDTIKAAIKVELPEVLNAIEHDVKITADTLDNYNLIIDNATVKLTINKIDDPNTPELPTITNPELAVFDNKLSLLTLSDDRFAWKNPDAKLDHAGAFEAVVVYYPDDENYNTKEYTITFVVAKKKVTISQVEKEYTYNGEVQNVEFTNDLKLGADKFKVTYKQSGKVVAEFKNAGKYSVEITVNDQNYEGSLSFDVEMKKANYGDVELPTNLTATYGQKLSDIELTEGFRWKTPDTKVTVGKQEYEAIYNLDPNNYNDKIVKISVDTKKADSIITAEDSYNFPYKEGGYTEQDLHVSLNHDGALLFNGKSSITFTPGSTTEVTISFAGNDNYNAASKKVTVIVQEQGAVTNPTDPREAIYGQKLSDLAKFPIVEEGTYAWKNPNDLVGDVGTHTHKAVFTKTDGSTEEFDVTVNVSPRELKFEVTNNTFTYDGKEHQIEYKLTGFVNNDNAETVGLTLEKQTNAGTYKFTPTITSKNYKLVGAEETTLVINKAKITININDQPLTENTSLKSFYDAKNPNIEFTYSVNGAVKPEDVLLNGKTATGGKQTASGVGAHEFKFTLADTNNYEALDLNYTVNIYPIEVTTNTKFGEGEGYYNLADAIKATKNAEVKTYIVLYDNITLDSKEPLTIGKNVELYIPHERFNTYQNYDMNAFLSGNKNDQYAILPFDKQTKNVELTITKQTVLNVEGRVTVGGNRGSSAKESANGTMGATATMYSSIKLEGTINVTGTMWVTGYVFGKGTIEVKNGGNLYEPFVVLEWRGGSNAGGTYQNGKIMPFIEYEMRNIKANIKINFGAQYIGIASIWTSSIFTQWNAATYAIIGKGAILELEEEGSYITKTYDETSKKSTLSIYGKCKDNAGSLDVGINVSTKDIFFGLCYNVKIVVETGATFTVNEMYKMLPGSELVVKEGATLNLVGQIIVYKDWVDAGLNGNWKYPQKENPKFIVEGTLNVTGTFAGTITLTDGKTAKVNLVNAKGVELTSIEGYGKRKGLFGFEFIKTSTQTQTANSMVDGQNKNLEMGKSYTQAGNSLKADA